MRALVVDADARAACAISHMLESSNTRLVRVGLAQDGMERARQHHYDNMPLALIMPDLSGVQVIRRMRGVRLTRPMPVLSRPDRPQLRNEITTSGQVVPSSTRLRTATG